MNLSPSALNMLLSRHTRRREFIALLGSARVLWPLAARAQQQAGVRHLGFLSVGPGNDAQSKDIIAAFLQGLDALGWKENVNLQIDWRWLGSDAGLAERQAAELVALKPDLLVAGGDIAVDMLRQQTRAIPLVFALVSDPVGMGYVESSGASGRQYYRVHQLRSAELYKTAATVY